MSSTTFEVSVEDQDEESDKSLVVGDVWEDVANLHKLQHGAFPTPISTMERDRVSYRVA